ncbi:hypothetical protein Y032_0732g1920 [Ancylostoma ceylanicum]|uniref:Uncharacterized protein n=1 Tax=Ancylostoma ceylanicum TaxID=53326 RepID=A0A016WG04_9BILA|nr:hypothetical protein Y032_0732g1920 [Ancylostoma ceylanicum]
MEVVVLTVMMFESALLRVHHGHVRVHRETRAGPPREATLLRVHCRHVRIHHGYVGAQRGSDVTPGSPPRACADLSRATVDSSRFGPVPRVHRGQEVQRRTFFSRLRLQPRMMVSVL